MARLSRSSPLLLLCLAVAPCQLLLNLALLKAFASLSATTATVCVGLAPSTAALKVCISNAKAASQKQVRQGSLEYLAQLLSDASFEIPPRGVAAAMAALGASKPAGRGVTDPDGAVRTAAARAYWLAAARYPDAEEVAGWFAKLGDKERKLVEKHRPA